MTKNRRLFRAGTGLIIILALASCNPEEKPPAKGTSDKITVPGSQDDMKKTPVKPNQPDNPAGPPMLPGASAVGMTGEVGRTKAVRKITLPGWIPATKEAMEKTLADFLAKTAVPAGLKDPVRGLVVPHAGYRFSGQCAAYAYKSVQGKPYKRVIILGPNHTRYDLKGIAVTKATHYETVLGEIPVDTGLCSKLLEYPELFTTAEEAEASEHSVAIQIPFIQTVLKDVRIVPLIIGSLSADGYQQAAEIIQSYVTDDTMVIASSDFTHYGPDYGYVPFADNIKEKLRQLDSGAIELIKEIDPSGFQAYCKKERATICGSRAITLLMMILSDTEGTLLNYYTSADLTGDYTNSVSYAAITMTDYYISAAEGQALIDLARRTLKSYLTEDKTPQVKASELPKHLRRPRGVFVTLKTRSNQRLRGCIGYIPPLKPLYQAVIDNAINSAVNDRRFPRMSAGEEPEVAIEISVLSALRRIKGPDDVIAGKHGVYLVKDDASGVFLPQVATEQGWDRDTFLTELCAEKAGLPADAWKGKDAKLYVFTAQIIEEPDEQK